jgi:hypothetical protein
LAAEKAAQRQAQKKKQAPEAASGLVFLWHIFTN